MIPVIPVGVLPYQLYHRIPVRRIVIRLDISLDRRIIRTGAMPEHALHRHLLRTLIAGTLRHHADNWLILITVLHHPHLPSRSDHAAAPKPFSSFPG